MFPYESQVFSTFPIIYQHLAIDIKTKLTKINKIGNNYTI
ncbi:hypothetical protein COO91_07484 [Nostoc flagelliforme CCNUN1]|uniref:Uncharacterized protein n=1 Tax=Nostoc flagelliforme CCNUN1 TaxID=2038116 RepID=A0A2K8T160_9NOSO|nr:hypothetical protein COO91_07484 [Nostoc flagelliforme CCNUN1]